MKPSAIKIINALAVAALAVLATSIDGPAATARPAPATQHLTRQAAHPADVTTLVQTRLHQFGYTIKIDGDYGPQTRRIVRAWQKANGLQPDGDAGPETLATLGPINFKPAAAAKGVAARQSRSVTPASPVEAGSVEAIIRDVWPDDIEDKAVAIATRESNLQPGVRNACCIGLFQIYFYAHQAWLSDYGANSPDDLFDPRINATVAYALYRSAGWTPWNCYGKCQDI